MTWYGFHKRSWVQLADLPDTSPLSAARRFTGSLSSEIDESMFSTVFQEHWAGNRGTIRLDIGRQIVSLWNDQNSVLSLLSWTTGSMRLHNFRFTRKTRVRDKSVHLIHHWSNQSIEMYRIYLFSSVVPFCSNRVPQYFATLGVRFIFSLFCSWLSQTRSLVWESIMSFTTTFLLHRWKFLLFGQLYFNGRGLFRTWPEKEVQDCGVVHWLVIGRPGTSLIWVWIFASSLSHSAIHLCQQPISSVYETVAHVASRLLYWKSVFVEWIISPFTTTQRHLTI